MKDTIRKVAGASSATAVITPILLGEPFVIMAVALVIVPVHKIILDFISQRAYNTPYE